MLDDFHQMDIITDFQEENENEFKKQHIGIPTNDIVHFLPFWENGVKFFTIEGPNKEKVEFSQYL
jgi:hypothetical protein